MKNLKEVELHFENCETARIDAAHVDRIYVRDASRTIECLPSAVVDSLTCASFHMAVKPKADVRYESFGLPSKKTLFGRIAIYDDIVDVTLRYDDGTKDCVRVPYEGDEMNALQDTKVDDKGCLRVTIARKEKKKKG